MRTGYVLQRLTTAVTEMARGTDTLPRRLADAVKFHLLQFRPEDFPEHLKPEFEYVMHETMKVASAVKEGSVEASTRDMPEAKVKQLIEKIVILFVETAKVAGGNEAIELLREK
jgi:hypothetical protein